MKAIVWTTNYRPLIFGGDVNAPIACEVNISGTFDLGKGYKGWLFVTPNGKTFVAETETGAIIGSTIEQVKEDIDSAEEEDMREQIEWAKEMVKRSYLADKDEFWKRLKGL